MIRFDWQDNFPWLGNRLADGPGPLSGPPDVIANQGQARFITVDAGVNEIGLTAGGTTVIDGRNPQTGEEIPITVIMSSLGAGDRLGSLRYLGGGADDVLIASWDTGTVSVADLDLGDGDNSVSIDLSGTASINNLTVTGGAGSDEVVLNVDRSAAGPIETLTLNYTRIETADGADHIDIQLIGAIGINVLDVDAGAGNDVVIGKSFVSPESSAASVVGGWSETFQTGTGDDMLGRYFCDEDPDDVDDAPGATGPSSTRLLTGTGNDMVEFVVDPGAAAPRTAEVDTGAGDDSVDIRLGLANLPDRDGARPTSLQINLGDGDDTAAYSYELRNVQVSSWSISGATGDGSDSTDTSVLLEGVEADSILFEEDGGAGADTQYYGYKLINVQVTTYDVDASGGGGNDILDLNIEMTDVLVNSASIGASGGDGDDQSTITISMTEILVSSYSTGNSGGAGNDLLTTEIDLSRSSGGLAHAMTGGDGENEMSLILTGDGTNDLDLSDVEMEGGADRDRGFGRIVNISSINGAKVDLGDGDDILDFGGGWDMTGGGGSDTFILNKGALSGRVLDFELGQDVLALNGFSSIFDIDVIDLSDASGLRSGIVDQDGVLLAEVLGVAAGDLSADNFQLLVGDVTNMLL